MTRSPRIRTTAWIGVAALVAASVSFSTAGAGAAAKVSPTPQLGLNSYVQDLCQSNAVWQRDASGQFASFKALGANSVALAFPVYTASLKSNTLFARRTCGTFYQTPSTARLTVAIKAAHALHLRVLLRPLLDETVLKQEGGWRGAIKPTNIKAWFKSYLGVLTPYLRMAQQQKVEYVSIATELDSVATRSNWTSFISSAKRLYKGKLIFTINWTETASGKKAWAGTSPGIDAYQAAALPSSATPSQLLSSWDNALAGIDKVPFSLSTASIDEVAILAQDGAYGEPWAWSLPFATYPFDQSIQANWYSMVCTFFKAHSMQGIYFWGVWYANGGNPFPKTANPANPQEIQPASAAVIKSCYTS